VVSILGTALSIAMIMVVVVLFQIKLVGYSPESARSRLLYVYGTLSQKLDGRGSNNGKASARVINECYYGMHTPEAVTASAYEVLPVSLPGKRLFEEYEILYTDPGFWKVFDFTFIAGHPFTEADFRSALPVAVVSDRLAALFFGQEEAIGKEIVIDYVNYQVVGVVKAVSKAATDAYADMWIPYTTSSACMSRGVNEGVSGPFQIVMLAHSSADFEAIRAELDDRIRQFNVGQKEYSLGFVNNVGPIDRLDIAIGCNGFQRTVTMMDYLLDTGALLLLLLLVPAFNLVSVIQSSVQKRSGEFGVRRAFGSSRSKLMAQVLSENMVVTLLGGVLGLLLSVAFLHLGKAVLLNGSDVALDASMILKPIFFISALCFSVLLNTLSAFIPAWRASKKVIVDALNN
ncbi:MAG: ABC transporter permease, partial [Tannerellaceae bacterium]